MIDYSVHYPVTFRFVYNDLRQLFTIASIIGISYHDDFELKKIDVIENEIEVSLPGIKQIFIELLIENYFDDEVVVKFLCDELYLYLKSQEDLLF